MLPLYHTRTNLSRGKIKIEPENEDKTEKQGLRRKLKGLGWKLGVRLEIEVKTDVFRLLFVEISSDGGVDVVVEVSNAFRDRLVFAVGSGDKGNDIADFGFDADGVAVFLGGGAGIDRSGALEVAEGVAQRFIAAAQNPVDDLALAHDIEVVESEVTTINHGLNHVGKEGHAGAGFVAVIDGREGEVVRRKFGSERWVGETDFVEVVFVFDNSEIVVKRFDLLEGTGGVGEAVAKSVFKAVGGEARSIIVGDGVNMIIGDLAREDAVFFELTSDGFRVADDLGGVVLDGLLGLSIAIHKVDAVLKSGGGDVVEEAGEGLLFVVSEMPDDEGDADAMGEGGTVSVVGV